MLTRGLFILALIPTLLILCGAVIEIFMIVKGIVKRDLITAETFHFGLFALVFIGYLAFIVLYALLYRDFFSLKVIFIYPALLSFTLLFLRSGEKVFQFLEKRNQWFMRIFEIGIGMLLILYIVDVTALILQLFQAYLKAHAV